MNKTFIYMLVVLWGVISQQCMQSSITTVSGTHAPLGKICSGQLIFEDNFNNFDLRKWQHEQTLGGGGNWEFQWYTNNRTNSYVTNGKLVIKPTLLSDQFGEEFLTSGVLDINGGSPTDQCTNPQWWGCSRTGNTVNILNPIKSARLRTVNSFNFKYGTVEVRAKIPAGDWLWPAIWLLPSYNQYSSWPSSGEIDLLECRGNRKLIQNGKNIGTQLIGSTLHWGPNTNINKYILTHFETTNKKGFDSDFHTYRMKWTENEIIFFVDNEEIGVVKPPKGGFWELGSLEKTGMDNPWKRNSKMAPFDQEFYLIINLAVGGIAFFPDDVENPGGKPWKNTSPKAATDFWNERKQWLPTWELDKNDNAAFQVDYVRVWAL